MYWSYFKRGLPLKRWIWANLALSFNVIEILALLTLSFVPSRCYTTNQDRYLANLKILTLSFRENFKLHKVSFTIFLASSITYMLISFWIVNWMWSKERAEHEKRGLNFKRKMLKINACCIAMALYFYYRHNKYCEPGVYSMFSLFEYGVVLTNMGYHWAAFYDFYDRYLQV